MTKAKCGCTPGTYENGWRETRSEACIEAEMKAWRGLDATARRFQESPSYQQDLRAIENAKTVDAVESVARAMKHLGKWDDHAAFVTEQAILQLVGPRYGPAIVARVVGYEPDPHR